MLSRRTPPIPFWSHDRYSERKAWSRRSMKMNVRITASQAVERTGRSKLVFGGGIPGSVFAFGSTINSLELETRESMNRYCGRCVCTSCVAQCFRISADTPKNFDHVCGQLKCASRYLVIPMAAVDCLVLRADQAHCTGILSSEK